MKLPKSQVPDYAETLILSYLIDHPEACDNLEGITTWWLSRQHVVFQAARVKRILDHLVRRGWLLGASNGDRRPAFKLNPEQVEAIRDYLAQQ